jgi:nucleoid-associated protein YgaU
MSDGSVVKAAILNVDDGGSTAVECYFNPKEYTFAKQNSWTRVSVKANNVAPAEFGGGQPATLTMKLLFDTYAEKGVNAEDVRKKYTDRILALMKVNDKLKNPKNKKSRPPTVRFQWGSTWSFHAVITSVSQQFTLFLPNGRPVRATMDVTFQQVKDELLYPAQNPTSGGDGGGRTRTVREGDTLMNLAYAEYGDTASWRLIADANKLTQLRRLTPGMVLVIPNGG